MDAMMSKVVQINLTAQEVQDILMHKIYAKYPDLADASIVTGKQIGRAHV